MRIEKRNGKMVGIKEVEVDLEKEEEKINVKLKNIDRNLAAMQKQRDELLIQKKQIEECKKTSRAY